MIKKLYWEAYSSRERMLAIEEIKHSLLRNDGYIINFNMFSDLALSLSIEIEEKHIIALYTSLQKVVSISDLDTNIFESDSNQEWMIFMNISFSKGTGNMQHEKPMVDG